MDRVPSQRGDAFSQGRRSLYVPAFRSRAVVGREAVSMMFKRGKSYGVKVYIGGRQKWGRSRLVGTHEMPNAKLSVALFRSKRRLATPLPLGGPLTIHGRQRPQGAHTSMRSGPSSVLRGCTPDRRRSPDREGLGPATAERERVRGTRDVRRRRARRTRPVESVREPTIGAIEGPKGSRNSHGGRATRSGRTSIRRTSSRRRAVDASRNRR
jgi:hypothetical protein